MHYQRMRLHGTTLPPARSLADRFWSRVDKTGSNGCWLWTGAVLESGYGELRVGPTMVGAHRVAWSLTRGPIPADLTIDHLCFNRRCVNPEHMEVVTLAENGRRGAVRRWSS